jgi:hypothetical protein
MREIRSFGSVRGVPGNRHSYRDSGISVLSIAIHRWITLR